MASPDELRKPLLSSTGGKTKPTSRSCNDIFFGILFLLMVAGMVVISSIAFSKGDPSLLLSSNSAEYTQKYGKQYAEGWMQNAVAQLKGDANVFAASAAIAVALGVLWIQLIRSFTKLFIYLTMVLGVLGVTGLGAYFVGLGVKQSNSSLSIVGYCLFGAAFLFVLLIIFLRKKIALTSAMFAETAKAVQRNPSLILTALLTIALFIGFSAYWTASFVYLYSVPGTNVNFNNSTISASAVTLPAFTPPQFNTSIRNLMYYMVFGFLWVAAFLSAVFQHSVAGAVSGWYFSRGTTNMGNVVGSPALVSFFRGFTTSFGSLAFGSLVIAVVEFMAFLLRLTKKTNTKNRFVVFVISCLQCLLGCVESIVKFINKFAYIYVAMHGYSFCSAARECFELLSRNMFNAVIMDTIGSFVLFMGKILFTAITLIISLAINPHLASVSIVLVGVISFVILHIIAHIIGVGVDTVFICYLEDLEMNKDGNLFMSPEVHAMLQDRSQSHRTEKA